MKIHFESSNVRERDLDLLLLEEMYVSPAFRQWIAQKLSLPLDAAYSAGHHSVRDAFGESDIELDFATEAGVHRVLIENKIDARFQLDQAVRYTKRADYYVRDKRDCTNCQTVLFAPRDYATRKGAGFGSVLLYEELRDWYQQHAASDSRTQWKTALLDIAIKKYQTDSTRSAQKQPNERANKFWYAYWTLASQDFPELAMPEPYDKTGGFNYLFPSSLLQRVRLVHSPNAGRVELWFGGVSGKPGEATIRSMFGAALEPDMTIRGTAGAVMIGLKVPSLNRRSDFFQQADKARVAMEAATRLAKWLEEHGSIWKSYQDERVATSPLRDEMGGSK
jgi:hypothetical protein